MGHAGLRRGHIACGGSVDIRGQVPEFRTDSRNLRCVVCLVFGQDSRSWEVAGICTSVSATYKPEGVIPLLPFLFLCYSHDMHRMEVAAKE